MDEAKHLIWKAAMEENYGKSKHLDDMMHKKLKIPYGTWLKGDEWKSERLNYSNTKKTYKKEPGYNRVFDSSYKYEQKLHRDDRTAKLGLDFRKEESSRAVGVRSSSVYGQLPAIEPLERRHVKVAVATRGFLSNRGIGIPLEMEKDAE